MRSPALKFFLFLATIAFLFCATPTEARSPVSVRLIGGMTQSASNAVSNETDDFTPIFGLGARYTLSKRHSIFFDVERYGRRSNYDPYTILDEYAQSREPLYTNPNNELVLFPLTLGYRLELFPGRDMRFAPHVSVGVSAVRLGSQKVTDSRYPPLDVSSDESANYSADYNRWKFGAILGLGCSMRINSWLSLDGTASYRHLSLPHAGSYAIYDPADTHQNPNQIVFEGTAFDQDPVRARVGGFEGKLVLEFRL